MDLMVLALIASGLVITCALILATILILARNCALDLTLSMPIGTWVSFDDILKLGYPRFISVLVLAALIQIKVMSARPLYEIIEESEIAEDGEITVHETDDDEEFDYRHPEDFEYMLHRRPRRKRKVESEAQSFDGALAPSRA